MNDYELDEALGRKLGWVSETTRKPYIGEPGLFSESTYWNLPPSAEWVSYLPSYTDSLDACHEARQSLTTADQKVRYQTHLYKLAEKKATKRNKMGQGIVSDYDAHTQGPREIAEAIYYALGGKI